MNNLLHFGVTAVFQYIQSKLEMYGVIFWTICDAQTGYMCKTEIYKGKEKGEQREVKQGEHVVKELISELRNRGRNITCDNFFYNCDFSSGSSKDELDNDKHYQKKYS